MNNNKADLDLASTIYTPAKASTNTLNAVRKTAKMREMGEGIRFPISDEFMEYVPDLLPGELMAIIAQTSNYKTGFMQWVARANAEFWKAQGITDRIAIYVSLEETIEEQVYMELARLSSIPVGELARGNISEWAKVEAAAVEAGGYPLYRIGFSLENAQHYQDLYLSNIYRSIEYLRTELLDRKVKIGAVFFDYLQAFPLDPEIQARAPFEVQRRLQVRGDLFRLKQLSGVLRAPVVIGVQAKQQMRCGNSPIQLPTTYDGEESSSIGQRADRVLTLWLPKTFHPIGTYVNKGGFSFTVTEDALWLKVAKQRGRLPAGKTFFCKVDYDENAIAPQNVSLSKTSLPEWWSK